MHDGWEFRHFGMVVTDLEAAIDLYKGLGFEVTGLRQRSIPAGELMVYGQPTTYAVGLKRCDLSKGGASLELLQPTAGEFIHSRYLRERGEGVNHIAFIVPDLRKEKGALAEAGYVFVFGDETFGFFASDRPGGLLLELVQKG
jgi:catechol 2,3-dioxygenase-like lactoylglutathione lyase family enzyme